MVAIKGFLFFADLAGCENILTGDELREAARIAVKKANMHVVESTYRNFPEHTHKTEYGDSVLTLIIPLEESHLCIHTWPAYRLVSIDLYTCGDGGARSDASRAVGYLCDLFKPKKRWISGYRRGL